MVTVNHVVLYATTVLYFAVGFAMLFISFTNSRLMNELFKNDEMAKQNKVLNNIAYIFATAYIMRAIGDSVVIT